MRFRPRIRIGSLRQAPAFWPDHLNDQSHARANLLPMSVEENYELVTGESEAASATSDPVVRKIAQMPWQILASSPVLLAAIVLIAGAFRLIGADWDQLQHLHPDERFLTLVGTQLGLPQSLAQYIDPNSSPLNPYLLSDVTFFVYGTFPLFLIRAIAELSGGTDYDSFHLVGRSMSALFDMGTVAMVFVIGRRLFDRRVATIAALLYALAILGIQLSHFFAVDTFSTFFATAAIYLAAKSLDEKRWYQFAALGVAIGLGLASKLSTGLIVPLLLGYLGWRIYLELSEARPGHGDVGKDRWLAYGRWPTWAKQSLGIGASLVVAAVTFRVAQPYAFEGSNLLDFRLARPFVDAVNQQRSIQEGTYDWPPGIQWANTTSYLFPLKNMVVWGLGPVLGLMSLAAFTLAAIRIFTKRHWGLILPVGWAALNFVYFGSLVLKTMRYFHPIYPMAAVLSAWMLIFLWDRRRPLKLPWRRTLPAGFLPGSLIAIALGGTLLSALAFHQIYSSPMSRIAASEWIFANIPRGSTIATEHWDDRLPLRLPGEETANFKYAELTLYDDESTDKRERLITSLESADYVILSSDRLAKSIPRMPARYPMAVRYYEALFSDELGFQLAAEFTNYPSLLGIEIVDDWAEEAFTVYDHPKVRIFRKTNPFDASTTRSILESVDISPATRILPQNATSLTLMFDEADRELVRQSGTYRYIYAFQSAASQHPALAWFAFLTIVGLAAWPITRLAFHVLPDSGYMLAKPFGILFAVYPVWLLASLRWWRFDNFSVAISTLILVLVSSAVALSTRESLWRELREKWKVMAAGEVLFLLAFAFLYAVRVRNPDLWHTSFGGEKPMDFAHLNAVIRTDYFPPYDPWWAGGYINYYYFGQVFTGAMAKLLGIVPAVAYNLGLPTMFALAVGAVFSFGFNTWFAFRKHLSAAVGVGLLAIAFVLLLGNLDTIVQLVQITGRSINEPGSVLAVVANIPRIVIEGQFADAFDFWRSTRVVEATVNEFPYFTFLYGDLHPHLIDLAWTAVTATGALALILVRPPGALFATGVSIRRRVSLFLRSGYVPLLVGISIALGVHRVVNPWDFPTYLVVTVLATFYSFWRGAARLNMAVFWTTAAVAAALVGASYAAFLPFHQNFGVFFGGIVETPQTTAVGAYLAMFGGPLLILIPFAALQLAPQRLRDWYTGGLKIIVSRPSRLVRFVSLARLLSRKRSAPPLWAFAAVAVVIFFALAGDEPWSARVFQIAAIGLSIAAAIRVRDRPLKFIPLGLLLGGLLLTAVPEWVALEGDIGRLNTVFKTYFQAWFLFGLAAAITLPQVLPQIWRRMDGWLEPAKYGLMIAIIVAIIGPALYPFASTQAKLRLRLNETERTLDGLAYMDGAVIHDQGQEIELKYDKQATDWLLENIQGRPVVLEATVDIYRWGSRVSIITGLPTVLGWDWHEKQQRWAYVHQVDRRRRDVEAAYRTTDGEELATILKRYDVELIYVGALERAYYPPEGIAKFDRLVGDRLVVIYQNPETKIYHVVR